MSLINAYNLVVKLNGTKIAKQTECRLSIGIELREKAGNSTWREYLAGLSEWSVSAQGLVCETSTSLLRLQIAKTLVTISFDIDGETFTGQAWIGQTSIGGGVIGKASWDASFTGNGSLS